MFSINALNDFPFNEIVLNGGDIVTISGSADLVLTATAFSSAEVPLSCSASIVCSATSNLAQYLVVSGSLPMVLSTENTPFYLYNDGIPVVVSDWPSPISILTTSWDDEVPTSSAIVTLER